jgi:hypothetical protein
MDLMDRVLVRPARERLACERPLRTAAATLADARTQAITSTTVVTAVAADDVDALEELAGTIADEFGLRVMVRVYVGCCAVRFTPR